MRMNDQLNMTYAEIKIWEKVSHTNIIKLFQLFEDQRKPDMYLLMEKAMYGQI